MPRSTSLFCGPRFCRPPTKPVTAKTARHARLLTTQRPSQSPPGNWPPGPGPCRWTKESEVRHDRAFGCWRRTIDVNGNVIVVPSHPYLARLVRFWKVLRFGRVLFGGGGRRRGSSPENGGQYAWPPPHIGPLRLGRPYRLPVVPVFAYQVGVRRKGGGAEGEEQKYDANHGCTLQDTFVWTGCCPARHRWGRITHPSLRLLCPP